MDKPSEPNLLAFIWGAIFAMGLWAASQYVITWMSWPTPPVLTDLLVTLTFAGLAVLFLIPSSVILFEIMRGKFEDMVIKAREERESDG